MPKVKTKRKKKVTYEASNGAPFNKELAQPIGEFLFEELTLEERSPATIYEIVKKDKKNVLYPLVFGCTDDHAAKQYRLQVIRSITNHIVVPDYSVGVHDEPPIRACSSVSIINNNGEKKDVYATVDEIYSNEALAEQVIEKAKQELRYWTSKYAQVKELAKLRSAITKYLD